MSPSRVVPREPGLGQTPSVSLGPSGADAETRNFSLNENEEMSFNQDCIDINQSVDCTWIGNSDVQPVMPDISHDAPWIGALGHTFNSDSQTDQGRLQYRGDNIYAMGSGNDSIEQALGVLSTNWLSPPPQNLLGWENQLTTDLNANIDTRLFGSSLLLNGFEMNREPQESAEAEAQLILEERVQMGEQNVQHGNTRETSHALSPATPSSAPSRSTEGEYYVDGDGARAPFHGHLARRRSLFCVDAVAMTESPNPEGQKTSQSHQNILALVRGSELVSSEAYNNMIRGIQTEIQLQSLEVDMSTLPSLEYIRAFAQLYFTNFHPAYPFLRKSTFQSECTEQWILLLAVATVGATYRGTDDHQSGDLLFSLLRKALARLSTSLPEEEKTPWVPCLPQGRANFPSIPILQCTILKIIYMLYSGKSGLMRSAFAERYCIVEACRTLCLLSSNKSAVVPTLGTDASAQDWLMRQSRIRTGMMIWLLDSMFAYEFGCQPLMRLTDAKSPLPCSEDIWESPLAGGTTSERSDSVTLLEALEVLYLEKRLPADLSQFSTILLIYGVYRKTKEVICDNLTQLSSWTPCAKIQARAKSTAVEETWPPSTPLLSNWRNSASDCLDILHWSANGKAAKSGGWEQHTIFHLHLARLILLTPTEHLQTLAGALSLTTGPEMLRNEQYIRARNHVLQWALRDQYKARLSIIHCGALFWHVRRFSTNSFLEPFGIYIATLVAWAYSTMSAWSSTLAEQSRSPGALAISDAINQDSPEDHVAIRIAPSPSYEHTPPFPEPSFIHLDRPCDDEMVQTYVQFGHQMSGYMKGVGDIRDQGAPIKILKEGIRLLVGDLDQDTTNLAPCAHDTHHRYGNGETTHSWGLDRAYAKVLGALTQTTQEQQL